MSNCAFPHLPFERDAPDICHQMFKGVFSKLDMMTHDVEYFGMAPSKQGRVKNATKLKLTDYVPPRIYQAARIRYLVKDDNPDKDVIEIPGFATFFVKSGEDGKLRCFRAETFLDPSPVFQRIAEKEL